MSDRRWHPSVGVVMPVRNGGDTIGAAIHGVLAQVLPVSEVVVVDGNSHDATLGRKPVNRRVKVVFQRGTGLGAARNQGIAALRTELVGFCDADDQWTPHSLAVRLDYLFGHAATAAVVGGVVIHATNGQQVPNHRAPILGEAVAGYTPGAFLGWAPTIQPFDETLRIAADTLWFVRMRESSFALDAIDQVVLHKGVGARTLSNDLVTYQREMSKIIKELAATRRRWPNPEQEKN